MPNRRPPRRPWWELRRPLSPGRGRALGAAAVALVLGGWVVLTAPLSGGAPLVGPSFLPAPAEVIRSLLRLFFDQGLVASIGVSVLRILKALGLSVLVAVPLGVAMGTFEIINRFFDPLVAPMRYLPITAFMPLLILWFGIDESYKVGFLFLGTVVYLLPVVVDAIRSVPDELVQTAFTLGATKAQVVRTVLIPAAMPQIFDSFRVVNAIAWTYIILAEMVNAHEGIGVLFKTAERVAKLENAFALLLVVGLIGLLTDVAISGLNRLLFNWREANA